MKAAVAHLEPHMEKADQGGKGAMVLATVKGDVHDIGKNLVDIILTNNGYTVQQPRHQGGDRRHGQRRSRRPGADAIGMSGLLVKSTLIMRDNLEELNRREPVPHPGDPGRGRPHPDLRRARPAPGLSTAASSTARTPSRACAPWTAWSS